MKESIRRLLGFLDGRWGRRALFGIALLVLLADQVTKWIVRQSLPVNGWWAPVPALSEVFKISHVRNTGGAFGIFPSYSLIFMIVAIAVVAAILLYSRLLSSTRGWIVLSLGLQLGGAAGNLLDRLRFGQVTDFIDISIWPVFNVADSSVVVGTILLGFFILFMEESPGPEAEAEPAEGLAD